MSYLSPAELAYQEAHMNENRAPELIAAVAILVSLSSVIIFLRITTRVITKVGFGADDYIIFVAWILVWGGFVGAYCETLNGLGKHVIAVKPADFIGIVKVTVFAGPDFFVTVMLTQLSILFLYKRVFTTIQDWFRITLYILGTLSLLTGFSITVASLAKCRPFSYAWTRYSLDSDAAFNNSKGHCDKGSPYLFPTHAIVTLFIDISIVLMPIPTIWRLRMSGGTRRVLTGLFLLGGFVAVINVVRLPQLFNIKDHDYTYTDVKAVIWSQAELNLGIVSACLPIFKPLLRHCKELITTNRSKSTGSASQPRTKPHTDTHTVLGGKTSSAKGDCMVANTDSSQCDLELGNVSKIISVAHNVEISSSEENIDVRRNT